jgi:hypothetical protein
MATRSSDRDREGRSSDPRADTPEPRSYGRRIDCTERGRTGPAEMHGRGRGTPERAEGERLRRAG